MSLAFGRMTSPKRRSRFGSDSASILAKLAGESGLPDHLRLVALEHDHLGKLLKEIGRNQDSEKAYSDALDVWKKLVAEHDLPTDRSSLAATQGQLAELQSYGKLDEAIAELPQGHRTRPEVGQRPTTTSATPC